MNNQQKNQAISDACPGKFKWVPIYSSVYVSGWHFEHQGSWSPCLNGSIMDNLNAMNLAVKALDINELTEYANELDKICEPVHICPLTHWLGVAESDSYQRAEAFGRVKKLWKN